MTQKITARSYYVLGVICLFALLINIDYTAATLAIIPMSSETGADLNTMQWLLSGYVLAWSAFVIPGGKLADIYGKRKMFLWGITMFAFASYLITLFTNPWLMIAGRVLQGFAGAVALPPAYGLVFTAFPEKKQGMAIGMIGAACGLGLAIGPTFAGYFLEVLNWRWIFYVNVPIAALIVAVILLTIDKEKSVESKEKLDWTSTVLLGAALTLFMHGCNQIEIWGFGSWKLYIVFAFCVLSIFLFMRHEKGLKDPFIPRSLFKNSNYVKCLINVSIFESIFGSMLLVMALYFQNIKNYDPAEAGYLFLYMTLIMGVLSPFGGILIDKIGARTPIVSAMVLIMIANLMASFLDAESSKLLIITSLTLAGLGLGLAISPINTLMMQSIEPAKLNTGSAIFTMCATAALSLVVIYNTSLLTYLSKSKVYTHISEAQLILDDQQQVVLEKVLSGANFSPDQLVGFSPELTKSIIEIIDQSYSSAMFPLMMTNMILAVIAIFFSLGLKRVRKDKKI